MNTKLALITGASSGIGKALAILLAKENVPLLLTGRNAKALEELKASLSPQVPVEIFTADLSSETSRQLIIEKIKERSPDLIINNAGFGYGGQALLHSTKDQLEVVEVNAKALLEITLEGAKHLKENKKGGIILNVSSVAAHYIFPFHAVYSSTKAFVNHLSLALDQELSEFGIRVLAACPGMVTTNFSERASKGKDKKTATTSLFNRLSNLLLKPMTAETAAHFILKQIKEKKPLKTFNFSFKTLAFLASLLPKSWTYAYFKKRFRYLLDK